MHKAHFIAIGGTGMGSMAGLMVQAGYEVRGSDGPIYPPMSEQLAELGIELFEGFAADHLTWRPDLVVLGNTCRADNVEYLEAKRLGLPIFSFPQLLGERFLVDRDPIVVAGTHGKTTTSSLIAHLLTDGGRRPGFLVGGIPGNFGRSYALGQPPLFVVEGDEYDTACFDKRPKFVHYRPKTVILTGIEFDHADIYRDIDQISAVFASLIEAIPEDGRLLVAADSDAAMALVARARCEVETYAVSATSDGAATTREVLMPLDWYGHFTVLGAGRQQLTVVHRGETIGAFDIPLTGAHNMANALAAIACAARCDVTTEGVAHGLASFAGVARRQQVRGVVGGVTVIDDFAHHPTAVRETLLGLRGVHGDGRLIAVFEPRSSTSRRKLFQHRYVDALAAADIAIVAPLFSPERLPADDRLDVARLIADLAARGIDAESLAITDIAKELARRCRAGDTVVVMSSGGFGDVHTHLLAALRAQRQSVREP